ncbi:hypothetical protein [Streptomyces sp. NPDC017993]|uniref:hypothetical protein n=1 Tax=Streptomyces sp. NPDC017993 TaxID=3365027 RepID=UPI0037B4DC70
MYVDARGSDVRLAEPDDLTHFRVLAVDLGTLAERAGQFGYLADGVAFVRSDWIRASGPRTSEWSAGLDAMLAFAESSGWVANGHVQARIVQSGAKRARPTPLLDPVQDEDLSGRGVVAAHGQVVLTVPAARSPAPHGGPPIGAVGSCSAPAAHSIATASGLLPWVDARPSKAE